MQSNNSDLLIAAITLGVSIIALGLTTLGMWARMEHRFTTLEVKMDANTKGLEDEKTINRGQAEQLGKVETRLALIERGRA